LVGDTGVTLGPKQPRLYDPGYLAWLRDAPCVCGCFQPGPCDASHLRAGSLEYNKPQTGFGRKPDDRWALPLKHAHHMGQHAEGDELKWWADHGIKDPFALCIRYYKLYGGDGGKPRKRTAIKPKLIEEDYQPRPIKPRLPRDKRAKITGRSTFR
jgi:hypothetical protein